jgi:GH24 family phage-related lysozyme (muramidase)
MRDRAFLIREAVRNGITDINSIRDTWEHRFDGESNQPTEDEYIAQRAKEKIQEALTHARNRKETIQPYIEKSQKYKEDELEKLQMFESELDRLYEKADLTSKMNLSYNEFGVPKITKVIDPNIQERIHRLQGYINNYKIECSKSHTHGPGCLATVMDDYGKTETWNERFAKNPRAVGFVEINDSDILPGDIVQFGSSYQDFQTGESGIDFRHAMMANTPYNKDISKMRYNGSDGGNGVRINSKYPSHWEETVGYRFVGDKADSLQWKKEYREKYGHQFSGEEPNIFTDTWDTVKGWFSKEEPKYITKDNYKEELSKFRNAFEEYHPQAYWDSKGKKWTVGTGLTYLIDGNGKEIPVRKGQRLSEVENQEQIIRRVNRDEDYARKKTPYWDSYHPELKFQILEAMYNAGNANVWEKSPKYQQALRKYEEAKGWKDRDYDLKDIFQHADWNLSDRKWLGVRSRMRRNPQAINPDDYSKIYYNHFRDSLRTVYDRKFLEK